MSGRQLRMSDITKSNDYNEVYEYNAHLFIRKKRHTDTSDNA